MKRPKQDLPLKRLYHCPSRTSFLSLPPHPALSWDNFFLILSPSNLFWCLLPSNWQLLLPPRYLITPSFSSKVKKDGQLRVVVFPHLEKSMWGPAEELVQMSWKSTRKVLMLHSLFGRLWQYADTNIMQIPVGAFQGHSACELRLPALIGIAVPA